MIARAGLASTWELEGDRVRLMEEIANARDRCRGWGLARWWRFATRLAAVLFLVFWWARVPTRFLVAVPILAVAGIPFGVVPLSVAWCAVFVAGRGAVSSFLRGDRFWIAMVVQVEPVGRIEVKSGRVDGIKVFDRSI